MKIGILNKITNPDIELNAIQKKAEIICLNAENETDLLKYDISDFDAVIISYKFKLSHLTINRLVKCKTIVCASVGYDNVDYHYAAKKNIKVFNVPDYGTNDVADHAIALLLSYARRINAYDSFIKEDVVKNWDPRRVSNFHRLSGMNIGIVGLGRIGTAVALRAKAFGMNVLFYDPYKPNGYDKTFQFVKIENLFELLEKSNIISIHTPLNSETEKMINWDLIKKLKNRPIIINTARGKIVDNAAICQAVKSDLIEAFLADVLEVEPPELNDEIITISKDPKFSSRIIITPHAASYAEESQCEMRFKSAKHAYKSIINNDYIQDCINLRRIDDGK